MKVMMLLDPETCTQCPFMTDNRGSLTCTGRFHCDRFRREIGDTSMVTNGRPKFCTDRDIEWYV